MVERIVTVLWESVALEIGQSITKLKSEYQKKQRPIHFGFRDACNQWVRRSDKYTHLIHRYPAKLLPYIPIFFLFDPEYKNNNGSLLDPFAGTGTVLLEGIIHPYNKMNTFGVEINPLARLISKVKTTPLNKSVLEKKAENLLSSIRKTRRQFEIPQLPNMDLWFTKRAQRDLSRIKHHIECLTNSKYKDFFRVCFSSIIRRSSLADPKIAPPVILKEIEYSDKRQTENVRKQIIEKQNPKTIEYFKEEIEKNIKRMSEFSIVMKNETVQSQIVWDDVKTLKKGNYTHKGQIDKSCATEMTGVDLVITSPPYINAQKYIRTLKFEIIWLGLMDYSELIELDKQFVGTERIYLDEYSEIIQVGEKIADNTIKQIYEKSKKRAGIVAYYYQSMATGMKKIYNSLNPGGRFVLVVGNNLVLGKRVQNHKILTNIATQQIGFNLDFIAKDEINSRGMITKRHETSGIILDEWVIVLSKN